MDIAPLAVTPKPPQFPQACQAAAAYIYGIENILRELIVEILTAASGPIWYKSRLPGDVLQRYREGLAYERRQTWTAFTPFHPIYYVEFPDLAKIIVQANNWNDAFVKIFGHKATITEGLSSLEPIRNRIAHNRPINDVDLLHLTSVYLKIENCLGRDRCERLLERTSHYKPIAANVVALESELHNAYERIKACQVIDSSLSFATFQQSWWFDSEYLGVDVTPIARFFSLVDQYTNLPRQRGRGVQLERWVKESPIHQEYTQASARITDLKSMSGRLFT